MIYIFVLQHILQKYLKGSLHVPKTKGSLHAPKTKGSSPLLSPSFISMIDFTNNEIQQPAFQKFF
jgi:hypothetical protein